METTEKPIKTDEKLVIFDKLKSQGFTLKRIAFILKRNQRAISNIKIGRANFSDKIMEELYALQKAIDEVRETYSQDCIISKEEEDKLIIVKYEQLLVKTKPYAVRSKVLEEKIIELEAKIKEKEKQIERLASIIEMFAKNP